MKTLKEKLDLRNDLIKENSVEAPNYFNIQDYLDFSHFSTYVFITMRNIGKTTSCFKLAQDIYESSGEFTVWMRSSGEELKNIIRDFKSNPPLGWKRDKYILKGDEVFDVDNGNLVIKFVSLSTVHNMSSIKGNGCFGIIYDEFLPRSNRTNPSYKALVDFVKTLERDKLLTVILIANATTYKSEILNSLNIYTDLDEMDIYSKRLRYRRFTKWDNPPNIKEISTAQLLAQDNERLHNYMFGAEFMTGDDDRVMPENRLGDIIWHSTFNINDNIVSQGLSRKFNCEVFSMGRKSPKLAIQNVMTTDTFSKHSDSYNLTNVYNRFRPIFNAMQSKAVIYTSFECKDVLEKFALIYLGRVERKE